MLEDKKLDKSWKDEMIELFDTKFSLHPEYEQVKDWAIKFDSNFCFLPYHIRQEINKKLDKGSKPRFIMKFCNKVCPEAQATRFQLIAYKMFREKLIEKLKMLSEYVAKTNVQKQLIPTIEEGNKVMEAVIASRNPEKVSRAQALHSLLLKCVARIKDVESVQISNLNPQLERVLLGYIGEMRDIIVEMSALASEPSDEQTIIKIVREELTDLLEAVKQIVLEVCPNDYEIFIKKLKLKLTEKGIFMPKEKSNDEYKKESTD